MRRADPEQIARNIALLIWDKEKKLEQLAKEKDQAIVHQNFEYAAQLRDEEKKVSRDMMTALNQARNR